MNRPPAILFRSLALLFALVIPVRADWIADSGYAQLSAELGASLPTGAGITVLQTEADTSGGATPPWYMPQASSTSPFPGTGNYAGKTFTVDSTLGGYSGHADAVASNFYGDSGSVAPGVTDAHIMFADDFFNVLTSSSGAPSFPGLVQNHSWIGGTTGSSSDDEFGLRAFDFMLDRDGVVACVPLNNGTEPMPVFMANCYNALSVGLLNGQHSLGGTTADGNGRMKPDLVVNQGATSFACPCVASCATLLRQAIQSSFTGANHPQMVKALLIAGATKINLPAWHRASSSTPYDSTFGAGELNVLNAYTILASGAQTASTSSEVSRSGWNYGTASSPSTTRYFFSIPSSSYANTFSAALTWHRQIAFVLGSYTSSLPNLTLTLYASSNFTIGSVIDQSNSTLDNVQHLFQYNLPAGQYALDVSSNTSGISYGLAWQSQVGLGPASAVQISGSNVNLNLANLDPYVTYTIQQSSDLIHWSNAATVLTSSSTASFTSTWLDSSASPSTNKFYQLQWTAVR